MSMLSIVQTIVAEGGLPEMLRGQAAAEAGFTRAIGVLARRFYQCIQQPHVIWAATEWTGQAAHDAAAEGIMKIRRDDRVAAACFRPGLYFEIFGHPVEGACRAFGAGGTSAGCSGDAGFVLVCHGTVADRSREGWRGRLAARVEQACAAPPPGLLSLSVFENDHGLQEFVAFLGFRDEAAYAAARLPEGAPAEARTLEERLFVEDGRSDLSGYDQFECRPLTFGADAGTASG